MSGCAEGILIDLSEQPAPEPTGCSVDNLLDLSGEDRGHHEGIHVSESMELFRDDIEDRQPLVQIDSPLVPDPRLVERLQIKSPKLDISSTKLCTTYDQPPADTIEMETFDFDLPLTPNTISDRSSNEDEREEEEEVFFGPVGFRERCAATVVDSATKATRPLSPLNDRQMAEIFKEAHLVANRISSAVSQKRSKSIKEKLTCSKQLNLGKTSEIFSPEAVGRLMQSVTKTTISDPYYENKENLTTQNTIDTGSASMGTDHYAIVSAICKSKGMNNDGSPDTPSRRHTRSGTYTVSKAPHEKLPENKRKSLPVVNNHLICDKEEKMAVSETKKPVKKRSLQPPSKLSKGVSKLQGPAPKKPNVNTSPPMLPEPKGLAPLPQEPKALPKESKLKPRSGLQAPKACSFLPSKLKIPGCPTATSAPPTAVPSASKPDAATVPSNIPAKALPQSSIPGLKGSAAPISKLQLIKPSGLQRPGMGASKKPGPLKAFNPAVATKAPGTTEKKEVADLHTITPAKEEKQIRRHNLLSSSFSTPNSGSTSSMGSPMSSAAANRRRSILPTPTKLRLGSTGSAPSPSVARLNSTSSMDSPLVVGSARKRHPSSTRKMELLVDLDDSSPSAMKPKRPLVTNTPNLPKKKVSQWSPVIKQKLNLEDQIIMCTKKFKK